MTGYAPILIPTLNRYEHLKRCVDSLATNTYANETELVIGLDFPPSEKYQDGYKKIKEYLPTISGFRKVTVLTTDVNLNPVGNFTRLVDYVTNEGYDSFISTEDDNEFSPNFLSYCNWALEYFKEDKSIFYICGYNLVETPNLKNNVYKYNHGFCAWGCATWLDRRPRELESYDFDRMKSFVDSLPLNVIFEKKRIVLAASLLYMIKKKYVLGDTAFQIIPDDYRWCIFPKLSLSRNWGHDGSGMHGGSQDSFERHIKMQIDDAKIFKPYIEGELYTYEIEKAYNQRKGHDSNILRIRAIFRFLFYKLTGFTIIIERPNWLKRR